MVKKVIAIAVLYVFMLSLLPSVFVTKAVEAATELKKVELNNPYYVMGAVQYKEKTFLIGKEANEPQEKIGVSVREGNNTSVIIPDSEIRKTDVWGHGEVYVLGDTSNKIYISSGSYVFIVDKNTNQYQKQTKEELLAPFMQVLKKNGYTDKDYRELLFDKDGLAWISGAKKDASIFVNKNGANKVITGKYVNIWDVNVDKNGNLYYVDGFENKLTIIDLNGKEITYNIPTGFGGKPLIDQNKNIYMEDFSPTSNLGVFKIENGQLKLIKTLPMTGYNIKQDNNGQIWYKKDLDLKFVNYVFGYIDNQFNFNDVYTTTFGAPDWLNYNIDDKNFVIYTDGIFGTSIQTQPLKGWVQKSGNWYYYHPQTGKMQTSWLQDQGTWYYLNGNGQMQSGWQSVGGVWYYFNGSGAMQSGWQSIGGKWYYFNGSGAMQNGWQSIGGTWYYFNGSGAMQSGWQSIGGTWYYFNGSGAMQSGWQSVGGTWYYFNGSGAMQSGWQLIGGKWYYLYASGQMAANTTIGGYKLGSNGSLI